MNLIQSKKTNGYWKHIGIKDFYRKKIHYKRRHLWKYSLFSLYKTSDVCNGKGWQSTVFYDYKPKNFIED